MFAQFQWEQAGGDFHGLPRSCKATWQHVASSNVMVRCRPLFLWVSGISTRAAAGDKRSITSCDPLPPPISFICLGQPSLLSAHMHAARSEMQQVVMGSQCAISSQYVAELMGEMTVDRPSVSCSGKSMLPARQGALASLGPAPLAAPPSLS